MANVGIHRLIEQRAAEVPESAALVEGDRTLTYRELNRRANLVARRLMNQGFRRCGQAVVNGERSLELAVVLLGVLKAGGAYSWLDHDDDGSWPPGLSFLKDDSGAEQKWVAVDVMGAMKEPAPMCPNLPIITRSGDVACVLRGVHGAPAVLVPHEAVTALLDRPVPSISTWTGDPGALDLWLTLMAGATTVVAAAPFSVAAA
jgi:hypothetical protein